MDRGFQIMLPQEEEESTDYDHQIKFVIFGKEISLSLTVKSIQE